MITKKYKKIQIFYKYKKFVFLGKTMKALKTVRLLKNELKKLFHNCRKSVYNV